MKLKKNEKPCKSGGFVIFHETKIKKFCSTLFCLISITNNYMKSVIPEKMYKKIYESFISLLPLFTFLPFFMSSFLSATFLLLYLSTFLPFFLSTFLPFNHSTFLLFFFSSFLLFFLSPFQPFYFSTFLIFFFSTISTFPLFLLSTFLLLYLSTFLPFYFSLMFYISSILLFYLVVLRVQKLVISFNRIRWWRSQFS